ncbi:isochorismatase family protein [Amorphus orientalis]|uniref:Nicotinamidase-related amidase n=1 Tax=Amorphus orientalis TaxID=649198 RepID=A0AAE3VM43_9HYPH|nr:isochorismatase family protein [Amorphus orientalis]MDQ0314463.1 nicotinamidase-related amidase [Amorphus orientalis]
MPALEAQTSTLLIIDLQQRLMPAIADSGRVVANARRLIAAARLLDVPISATEQYPEGLGGTVPGLLDADVPVYSKTTFDSMKTPSIAEAIRPEGRYVVAGCEAHVCVLQTVLGLLAHGCDVAVVQDAIGSRIEDNRKAACRRMERHGAEPVTTEMVLFEWLGDSRNPRFREAMKLIKPMKADQEPATGAE